MKLTKEFIELQGFHYEKTYDKHLNVYSIKNGENTYELIWDTEQNMITIFKFTDDEEMDEENEIFCDQILTAFQFVKMLIIVDELTDKGISFPKDFVQKFYRSRYRYSEQEFNEMCEACIVILLANENYEACPKLIKFRQNYISRKGWEYKEMSQALFQSYSDKVINMA